MGRVTDKPVKVSVSDQASLLEAFSSGENTTITLTEDLTVDTQCVIDNGQTVTLKMDGHTIESGADKVGSNGRIFQVTNGTLVVNGGTFIASDKNYGVFRVEADGNLTVKNATLKNAMGNGLNVKVLGGSALLDNVVINSTTGGGIEVTEADLGTGSKTGSATIKNCTFTQSGYYDWCSTCLSVSGGSYLSVDNTTCTSENWALYVFSSGGVIEVNSGTFIGNRNGEVLRAEIDTNTYPNYEGGLVLNDGKYNGSFHVTSPAYLVINGGEYTNDPETYLGSGKTVTSGSDSTYIYKVA